jgi:hypothetical protein
MLKRAVFAAATIVAAPIRQVLQRTCPQRVLIAGTEDGAIVVDLDWRGIIRRSGPRFVSQARPP